MFWNNQLVLIDLQALIDVDHFIDLLREFQKVTPHLRKPLVHVQLLVELHMQGLLVADGAADYHVIIYSNVIHGL